MQELFEQRCGNTTQQQQQYSAEEISDIVFHLGQRFQIYKEIIINNNINKELLLTLEDEEEVFI